MQGGDEKLKDVLPVISVWRSRAAMRGFGIVLTTGRDAATIVARSLV